MKNIRPITDLRNTNKISEDCHQSDEPIFITKNGYNDLVIMSDECYNNILYKHNKEENIYLNDEKVKLAYSDANHHYIKVGCATNDVKVANPKYNTKCIIDIIKKHPNLDILVFPELSISGYTCQDIFYQDDLLDASLNSLLLLILRTNMSD